MSVSQTHLVGEPSGAELELATTGRVIRPFIGLVSPLVEECRLHATPDGVSITAVDPANVAIVSVDLHGEALEDYTIDGAEELTIGFPLETVESLLSAARQGKRSADDVTMRVDESRTRVDITREYTHSTVERTESTLNIDADSVRESPDLPTMEQSGHATVDRQAFTDAVDACGSVTDHIRLDDNGDGLILEAAERDNDDWTVELARTRFTNALESSHNGDGSLFSTSYIQDIADGLTGGNIDQLTIDFEEQFPARFAFNHTTDEATVYEGCYIVAPRIRDDDGGASV